MLDFSYFSEMGFRRAARTDDNQTEVIKGLRMIGVTVKPVHTVKGFVDIIAGYKGQNFLFEIKDSRKVKSARKLTEKEREFQEQWRGSVHTIHSWDEAWQIIQAATRTEPTFAEKLEAQLNKK